MALGPRHDRMMSDTLQLLDDTGREAMDVRLRRGDIGHLGSAADLSVTSAGVYMGLADNQHWGNDTYSLPPPGPA